jgi:transcriptional regulator with XRE-family HTH domain
MVLVCYHVGMSNSSPSPKDPSLLKLGRAIRELRRERGMTQALLAAAVGVDRIRLLRVEHGRSSPSIPLLVAIAVALDYSVQELMGSAGL